MFFYINIVQIFSKQKRFGCAQWYDVYNIFLIYTYQFHTNNAHCTTGQIKLAPPKTSLKVQTEEYLSKLAERRHLEMETKHVQLLNIIQ